VLFWSANHRKAVPAIVLVLVVQFDGIHNSHRDSNADAMVDWCRSIRTVELLASAPMLMFWRWEVVELDDMRRAVIVTLHLDVFVTWRCKLIGVQFGLYSLGLDPWTCFA